MKNGAIDVRAGRLLARTRQQADLTQAQVAARAGLPQSTVSAYESGRRQPTLPMLSKLLEAMGSELTTAAVALPERLLPLSGPVGLRLRRHRHLIVEAAAGYGAENVRVLGAVTRGEDQPGGQIELLVDENPAATPVDRPALITELEEILGVPVKMLTPRDLSHDRRTGAEHEAIAL